VGLGAAIIGGGLIWFFVTPPVADAAAEPSESGAGTFIFGVGGRL